MSPPDSHPAGATPTLWLPDGAAGSDLATFARRAKRIDASGAVRLTAHGSVLTVTTCALHGAGGPTVLAMRVLALAEPSDIDATVALAALTDRLAQHGSGQSDARFGVPIPPGSDVAAAWAGLLPPRRGWVARGTVELAVLAAAAREGIAAVADGMTAGAGAAAVARLRARVWSRPLPGVDGVPAGVAFAADAFGFLGAATPGAATPAAVNGSTNGSAAGLHRAGPWIRVSTERGHVLARPPVSLLG